MKHLYLLFICATLAHACASLDNEHTSHTMNNPSGIPITRQAFQAHVETYSREMKAERSDFTTDELILMTRIWNTLEWQNLRASDSVYAAFCSLYYPNYYKLACEKTEATLSKGMAMYSAAHDLWLGGGPHANSQFQFED